MSNKFYEIIELEKFFKTRKTHKIFLLFKFSQKLFNSSSDQSDGLLVLLLNDDLGLFVSEEVHVQNAGAGLVDEAGVQFDRFRLVFDAVEVDSDQSEDQIQVQLVACAADFRGPIVD